MSGLGKVSFSFSKITKKPSLQVQPKETVKKVDKIEYIDSIENNSVQLIDGQKADVKMPLIIPLQHPNLLLQSVIDTVKSRKENSQGKLEEQKDDNSNGNELSEIKMPENNENEPPKKETLEEMAARELLEDATDKTKKSEPSTLTVPLANENYNKEESSMEDYENVPINDFGLAMLRGMGWDPKKGIGKNGQIVKVAGPTVRAKGLGLGADKSIAAQKPVGKNVSEKEVLGKGSKVRVTVGPHKNLYGTVEGFDDDAGRINLFMAISNERVSMNECFVQLVTPDEFSKYSKVLNINAYNNYKEKESIKTEINEEQGKEEKKNIQRKNGRSDSPNPKDERSASSSRSKYDKSKKLESDDKYSRDSKSSSSSHRDRSYSKKYDSSSDSDSHKHSKPSTSSSSKSRHRSKHYDSDDDRKDRQVKSKHSSKSKHSKKYSSGDDSSSDDKYRSAHRSKDSRKDRERRKSPSPDSDYDRKHKHKKSKKKKHRSRSRSRR